MAFLRPAEGVSLRRKSEGAGSPATALLGEGDSGASVGHGGARVSLPPPETQGRVSARVCLSRMPVTVTVSAAKPLTDSWDSVFF